MPQRRQAFPEDLPPLPDIDSADDGLPPLPDIEPAPIPKRQEPQRPVAATPAKQVQVRDLVQIPEPDPRRDLRMPATPDPAGWRTTPMPWETKAAKLEQRPMPVPPMARPGAMREMKVPGAVARVVDPTLSAFGRGLSGVASDLGGAARAIAEKAPIKTPRMRALEGIGELVAEHADLPQPKWIGQTEARKSPALASAASALDTAAKSLSRNPTAKAPQWVHDLAANPTRLHDPSYVVNLAFEGMGSSAAFLAGGLAAGARAAASLPTEAWRKAAKWAVGSTTGALLESAADAGGAFNEEIARGTDPKVAAQVFTEIMKREVPVTVATNALGEFVPTGGMGRGRRLLQEALTVGVEGIEEPAQGVAQRSAQRDVTGRPMDIWDPVLEEFVGGALGRVGVGSASAAASAIKERMAPAPQGRQDQAFDVNEEKPKLETGAVVDPLDDIALPPIPDEAADTSEPWQRANAQAAREDLGLPELPDEPIEITAKTEDAPTKRIVPEPTGDAPVRPDAVDVASQPQPTAQPAKPAARFESRSATDAGGPTVEDSAFDELVESRLRDVIPDKAERDAFTVKVTETDYNPEWRAAAHNDAFDAVFGKRSIKFTKANRETEFERVANLAMEKAREEFPEEGTFAEVSLDYVSRPSTSGPYPTEQGIALRLVDNPAGYQYPSQRVFDRASEIYTAITGGEGPSIPKPRLETKRQGGLGGSAEGESIGQHMLPPSNEKANLTPDEKSLLDEMFSRGRAHDNEEMISSDLFIEDFNRGNAALIGLIEKGLVERSTGGGPVKYTRSIGKPSIDTVEAIRGIQGGADAPVSIAKLRESGVTDEQLLRSADRESVQLWESHLNAGHPDVKANPKDFLIHDGKAYNAAYYPPLPSRRDTQSPASAQPSMPKGLAAAKPRYGYGKKQFTLSFENVADMAAYIASSPRPSKHHQEYLQYAMGALGTDADGVKAHGARLRESIKGMAKASEPGNLAVPSAVQQRKFEVAQVRSGRGAVPTPEGLRVAFPDWTWTQDPQGFLWAKTPSGGRIKVDLREGNIKASVAEIERQLGRQRKRGELVTGEFVSGEDLIVLSKHADYGTFHYETFRWAWKNLLRPVEREALLERYGTETNAAIAFRDMGGSRTESGVLATLRGWLDRIAEAILSHSPDRIMRRLARRNKSSIWERAAMQVNLNAEDRIRTIRDVLSRQNYGRLRYLRPDAQEALLKGTPGVGSVDAKVRIVQMAPRIDEMLKGVGGWAAFRDYAIDSRLAGVQDRWWKLRSAVLELADDDMRGQIEGDDAPIGTLLDLIADLERNRAPQGTVVSQARSRVIGILNKDGPAAAREYIGKYFAHLALAIKRKDLLTAHGHTLKEYLALPEVQQSLDLYREYLGDAVEASHVANEGFLSEALGPMGVWYPLVPVKSLEEEKAMVTLHGRDEWLKPINPTNFFTFGLAPEYDSSMEAFTKAVGKALESNNRAAAMDALVKVGLAKRVRNPSKRGVGNFFGENMDAVGYSAPSLRTVKVKGQKLRVPMEHYIIPAVLERELAPLVEERPYGKHWATDATSAATRFALLGPFDNRYHLSMQISAMDNGLPWLPSTGRIPGFVRNIPLVKTLFGMRDIYNAATKEINSEDGEAFMREMAQVGAVSPRANTSTVDSERAKLLGIEFTPSPIQRQYWTEAAELTPEHLKASRESRLGAIHIAGETAGPALAKAGHTFREKVEGLYGPLTYGTNGIDNAARFALWKWHKENFPDAPLIDRVHFVNQVGNYTWGMMGSMERTLKAMPGGPFLATFATAGLTNLRNGLRYALGWAPGVSPHPGIPMDQLDFKQRMKLKMASSVTGGLLMATMLWVLVSKYTSGEWPWEDEKSVPFRARFSPQFLRENPNIAKMVEAVAGKDPSLEKYFDLGFASPALVRGARAIGAMETWKQWQHGKRGKYGKPQYSASQVAWEAARDAGNTLVTPFLSGPAFQLSTSLFGIRPYVTSMYDRSGNFGPQIYARQIQADDPFAWIGKSAFNAAAQSNDLFGAAGEGLYTAATGYDITPHSRRDYGSAPLQAALQMVMPRFGPVAYNAAYYQNTAQQATRRIKQQAKKAAAEAEKRRRDRGR